MNKLRWHIQDNAGKYIFTCVALFVLVIVIVLIKYSTEGVMVNVPARIVYLSDGSWAVSPHTYLITLDDQHQRKSLEGIWGEVGDTLVIKVRR